MNTLSEIEEYYKAREQQLLEKLHQQEAALAAAEQTLKQLTENQKTLMDETTKQRAARERAFKEELYRDSLTGAYNRRYYEEVVRKSIGPAGIALRVFKVMVQAAVVQIDGARHSFHAVGDHDLRMGKAGLPLADLHTRRNQRRSHRTV